MATEMQRGTVQEGESFLLTFHPAAGSDARWWFIEKEFSLNRLGNTLKRLLNNPDPEVEGGHDHASPDALPTWLFGLCFNRPSPRTGLPARLLCPSRFVSTIASPRNVFSHTTPGHSKDKARSGMSRVLADVSPVICRGDQGKPSRSPLAHQFIGVKELERWPNNWGLISRWYKNSRLVTICSHVMRIRSDENLHYLFPGEHGRLRKVAYGRGKSCTLLPSLSFPTGNSALLLHRLTGIRDANLVLEYPRL